MLERMTSVIEHRGPDGYGVFHDAHAFLGHRRLSIIDVAAGHQPMANETRAMWIIYNGEIFNHATVRPDWSGRAIATYPAATPKPFFTRLRNMAPIASIVSAACSLSPSGIPVPGRYSARATGLASSLFTITGTVRLFAFASEIKALLEHPDISRGIRG